MRLHGRAAVINGGKAAGAGRTLKRFSWNISSASSFVISTRSKGCASFTIASILLPICGHSSCTATPPVTTGVPAALRRRRGCDRVRATPRWHSKRHCEKAGIGWLCFVSKGCNKGSAARLREGAAAVAHVAVVVKALVDGGANGEVHAKHLLQRLAEDVRGRVPERLQRAAQVRCVVVWCLPIRMPGTCRRACWWLECSSCMRGAPALQKHAASTAGKGGRGRARPCPRVCPGQRA